MHAGDDSTTPEGRAAPICFDSHFLVFGFCFNVFAVCKMPASASLALVIMRLLYWLTPHVVASLHRPIRFVKSPSAHPALKSLILRYLSCVLSFFHLCIFMCTCMLNLELFIRNSFSKCQPFISNFPLHRLCRFLSFYCAFGLLVTLLLVAIHCFIFLFVLPFIAVLSELLYLCWFLALFSCICCSGVGFGWFIYWMLGGAGKLVWAVGGLTTSQKLYVFFHVQMVQRYVVELRT